jgi:hypothetical protein
MKRATYFFARISGFLEKRKKLWLVADRQSDDLARGLLATG